MNGIFTLHDILRILHCADYETLLIDVTDVILIKTTLFYIHEPQIYSKKNY